MDRATEKRKPGGSEAGLSEHFGFRGRARRRLHHNHACAASLIGYWVAVHLWRHNSYTQVLGAPDWFLEHLAVMLSIPVEEGTKRGTRFGHVFRREDQLWGSMLVGDRVPAGLTHHVVNAARHYSAQGYHLPVDIRDCRMAPPEQYPWFSMQARPRPYQDWVQDAILQSGGVGVIDAPPRSGKTFMGARAIDTFAQPTIWVAPSLAIVRQTYLVFKAIFGDDMVARVDGETKPAERDISKPIVIATTASAIKLEPEFWKTRQCLVIDEFHHAASDSYHILNRLAENVYHRLCFTGTHWRTGADALAMEAVCSHVLYRIPVGYLVQEKFLATPHVCFVSYRGATFTAHDWMQAYDVGIVNNESRNAVFVSYAVQLADQGHQVIVLTNRRAHADYFGEMIPEARVAKGGQGALTGRTVREFTEKRFPVLVGTSVIGEGVDVPSASVVLYAGGLGGTVQMMQSYFRPFTADEGKTHGLVYDLYDQHHPTLMRQAESRLRVAQQHLGPWLTVR